VISRSRLNLSLSAYRFAYLCRYRAGIASHMKNKAVLISGAGIAGPALAFWLKAAGFVPTIIEHASRLRTGGYVIDFWGLGYDIVERMGLAPDLNRIGYHMREMRIVDDVGKRVAGFGTNVFAELTGGRFITLGRTDLSRLLFQTIKDKAEVIFGDEIVALSEHAEGVEVRFRHSTARQFDLVIGADGLHSRVRTLVFGPEDRFEKQLGYIAAAFEVRGYRPRAEDIYVVYCEPGRMIGRFALHDDRTLFLFVFAHATDPSTPIPELTKQKAILHENFGEAKWECSQILRELDRAEDLYFDRVSQIRMDRWTRGRIALVGDAAFCVSLMAGQGSALAITAAYVLAGELASAGGRHELAFDSYERMLRGFIDAKQRGATRFAAAFAPRTRWGLFTRNQLIKAFAIPGVARFSFGRDIVDTLQLTDYSWRSC
jgi:2-polyprenyl-6-methoxyphenol hydroxylase-like FAD-dependent oxidoreductase